jgi:HlyD family secretion protein
MKTRWILLPLLAAAAVGAFIFIERPNPVAVSLYVVASGPVKATVSNTRVGTVKACRRAYLAPASGGQVAKLEVTEGDHVAEDQVLLEIWNEDLRSEVELAVRESEAAKARANEACAQAEGARREAKRLQRLEEKHMVSEEEVDLALTKAEAQQAACQASQASTRVSTARILVATTALERTIVRAPFAGVVAEVNAELGGYVTPSPPGIPTLPAVDLLDLSCLYVTAPIDEVDAPAIRTGMPACISLDAFPKQRCNANVRRIAPYVLDVEKQARTVEVEVEITDPDDMAELLPGYSADVEITLDSREDTLRIPTEAILEGQRVLVFDPESKILEERGIEIGLANWEYTEVKSGLKAGEQIVTSVARDGVKAGALVKPDNAPGR